MKLMVIFLAETETHGDIPLYEALVRKLNQKGIQGASVLRGVMGFGKDHHVHRNRLFGISDDRPVMIVAADSEENLRNVVASLRKLAPSAPMLLMDAEQL
jgi:PII-like signaling protein